MRRTLCVVVLTLGVAAAAVPASAQSGSSFSIYMGGFTPAPLDARGSDDVIFQNNAFLSTFNRQRGIDINQFNGFTIGGEYLIALGRNFEGGLGVGWYQRTVPVLYTDSVNANGDEIVQDIKLRIVPFSATFRFLPLSHGSPVQPYIGAGVGVLTYRYSETGEFIDNRNQIFVDNFTASGAATGPMVLGGVRFATGPMAFGGEIRWQDGKADLPKDQGFAGSKIDLGGFNYLFTVNFRF